MFTRTHKYSLSSARTFYSSCSFQINFNIILPSLLKPSTLPFPFSFFHQNPVCSFFFTITSIFLHHHHHHHIPVMELGHLLTRSVLTYPEVSSKVYHDSFYQLGSSISLPWVIYFEAFYLHVLSSCSCIPVICPKLVLFLTPLQFVNLILQSVQVYPAVLLMYFISAAVILT